MGSLFPGRLRARVTGPTIVLMATQFFLLFAASSVVQASHNAMSRNNGTCSFVYATQHSYSAIDLASMHVDTRAVWYINGGMYIIDKYLI